MKIVECVPNFSEGRCKETIDAISQAIKSVAGVKLLDIDAGQATNRTVYTFAGEPEVVLEAAFRAIKTGSELIDMKNHKGTHARMGACDVCPFVPVSGITMDECIELANKLGKMIGDELGIPVYLYAEAARILERKRLPDIRAGEYEALPEKMKKAGFKPDFGPSKFNSKSGATVIGARKFLIAYNVNLNVSDIKLAKQIAFEIRETGKLKKNSNGEKIIGSDGQPERIAGRFKSTQATGWVINEYGRAQVTINILDLDVAPLHEVFDACVDEANKIGVRVTGSEVIGMIPKQALLNAGIYFIKKYNGNTGIPEEDIMRIAVQSMGLSEIQSFDVNKKVIEYQFKEPTPLVDMKIKDFVSELSRSTPAPGGGSVAALSGSLAASLCSMVSALTYNKKGYEQFNAEMKEIGEKTQIVKDKLLIAIDEDTKAFNNLYECFSMPKNNDEEKGKRNVAIEECTKIAAKVPLNVMKQTLSIIDFIKILVEKGNQNSLSDAGVAALMCNSCARGAYYNVLINIRDYIEKDWAVEFRDGSKKIMDEIEVKCRTINDEVLKKLNN